MPVSNALISSIPNIPNLYNLAVFICHLLIDGHFRSGHILYDPNVFDGHLITEINSICPRQFPWQTTDITQNSIRPWSYNENTDNIMQLIFFDPKTMPEKMARFYDHFIHYQIFIFSTIDEIDAEEPISMIKKLNPLLLLRLSTLVLHYNTENGLIHIYSIPNMLTDDSGILGEPLVLDSKAIAMRNQKTDTDHPDLFDRTFGNFGKRPPTRMSASGWNDGNHRLTEFNDNPRKLFVTNYYYLILDAPYLEVSFINPHNLSVTSMNFKIKQRKYYKELSDEVYGFNGNDKS